MRASKDSGVRAVVVLQLPAIIDDALFHNARSLAFLAFDELSAPVDLLQELHALFCEAAKHGVLAINCENVCQKRTVRTHDALTYASRSPPRPG